MPIYQASQAGYFEQLLQHRHHELQRALQALHDEDPSAAPHEVSDFKDVALRHQDTDMDELQAQRLQSQLRQVSAALGRLAAGHYGTCLACARAVDLRRLQAIPEAELCAPCQADQESRRT